jgi:hypothetical protein
MNGKFYVLPPFDESALNCNWGDLKLKRLDANALLLPPESFDAANGRVLEEPVPAYHG